MGVPSITTNLAGFGCYMQEKIENPSDYGIYVVDRRSKSVEDSIQQLADYMFRFTMLRWASSFLFIIIIIIFFKERDWQYKCSRRQRINLRNRTERLSELLDWETMGVEYVKARKLALLRAFPEMHAFVDSQEFSGQDREKMQKPMSAPPSPRLSPLPDKFNEEDEE
jgi:glycogen(starch) synthase